MLWMMQIDITPLRASDSEALKLLLRAADLPVTDLTPALLSNFLVAYSGTELTGAAGIECYGEVGLLRSVVVESTRRGTGLGKQLVAGMEAQAREQGVGRLYLLTTTAERFFAGLGYRALARETAPDVIRATAQFSELCPSSSTFMLKEL
jgi:amino-acid N-acetyltransferase